MHAEFRPECFPAMDAPVTEFMEIRPMGNTPMAQIDSLIGDIGRELMKAGGIWSSFGTCDDGDGPWIAGVGGWESVDVSSSLFQEAFDFWTDFFRLIGKPPKFLPLPK